MVFTSSKVNIQVDKRKYPECGLTGSRKQMAKKFQKNTKHSRDDLQTPL